MVFGASWLDDQWHYVKKFNVEEVILVKKPYRYTEKSSYVCIDCGKELKANLVERKENKPLRCYSCGRKHEGLESEKDRNARRG
jgi:DNA-directed RNA polymerase subunit RPC12/RpoP